MDTVTPLSLNILIEWSKSIDISTVGLAGCVELERQSPELANQVIAYKGGYSPMRLEFGLIIQPAPDPFNKTIFVKLVPRYILVNKLDRPLVIKEEEKREHVIIPAGEKQHVFYY